ncbi:MAG: hypothetical protein P4L81_06865 [Candidatus Pacebacteria bacterium]|nr:hypothetical protein [Candidatus Paceibacterota bacterium]
MSRLVQLIVSALIVAAFVYWEPLRYWTWEIGGSIILDVLLIGMFFFVVGILISICQNWKISWKAIGKALKDALQIVSLR